MTAGKSSASAQATAPASPNQVFLPASLFGLAAGIVISNNIFILKALACDFYFLYAEHRSPHSPQECAAEPKVEQLMGGLTTIHAVVTALLGAPDFSNLCSCVDIVADGRAFHSITGIVGIRIMRPVCKLHLALTLGFVWPSLTPPITQISGQGWSEVGLGGGRSLWCVTAYRCCGLSCEWTSVTLTCVFPTSRRHLLHLHSRK